MKPRSRGRLESTSHADGAAQGPSGRLLDIAPARAMRRKAPAPAAGKSVHEPRRDAELLTIASYVLAVEPRAIPNGDQTIAALSARRTIGFAQEPASKT
jgi:hypothetical protein